MFTVLPFSVANQRLALPLSSVERVMPALACTPLPGAPAVVRGVVRIGARVLPVVDLARRFGWSPSLPSLWQPFIWLRSSRRELMLMAETVEAAVDLEAAAMVSVPDPSLPTALLKGAALTSDGLLLIQDVEQLLALDDERALSAALAAHAGAHA